MPCPNCGSEQVETYCAHCGQRFHPAHSMREFVRTAADDQLGVDAKLPRTLKALFLKPGLLTTEYMNGRIARYIPPFRLYLFASVLFFVLLSFLSRRSDWAERAGEEIERQTAAADSSAAAQADSAGSRGLQVGISLNGRQWLDSIKVNTRWRWLDQKLESNMRGLRRLPPNLALRRITDAIIEELPKVMFLLLPVFALLLKVIYVRRKRYYVEHFIFALHVHAFAFVLFAIMLVFPADWIKTISVVAIAFYLFLAMKRVYQQGFVKTTLKWAALATAYSMLLSIGVAVALIWALAATSAT